MKELVLKSKTVNKATDFSSFTAVIMEPEVDLHGDIVSADEIKKAAHKYLEKQKMQSNLQHMLPTTDLSLVESYILDDKKLFHEIEVNKGAWIGVFKVSNPVIKTLISSGDFNGVSIGAVAKTEEIQKSLENPHAGNPKRRLSDLEINEISLVDYPANNKTILQVNKNKGDIKMTLEEILKAAEADPKLHEELLKAFKKKKKEEEDDDDENEEDIEKALTPKLAKLWKAQKAQIESLEKAQNETVKKAFDAKVSEIKKYSKVDDTLSDALMAISKSNPEAYKAIEKTLDRTIDTIKKSAYMTPIGGDNPYDESIKNVSDVEKIKTLKKSLMQEEGLSSVDALKKIYLSESQGRRV